MAMTDALTHLPNRRYVQSFLEYKFSEYKRFGALFALMMLDLDDFRAFNNRYGHDCGDLVLTNIASSIKYSLRESDMFGRWGGEEFVGIFSVKKKADIHTVVEKLCALVANSPVQQGAAQLSVTVSIGATLIRETYTMDSIVKRADALMYQSKKSGKNCATYD